VEDYLLKQIVYGINLGRGAIASFVSTVVTAYDAS